MLIALGDNGNKVIKVSNRVDKIVKNLSKSQRSKNEKFKIQKCKNIRAIKKLIFLIYSTKKVFNHLRQVFIKALIL